MTDPHRDPCPHPPAAVLPAPRTYPHARRTLVLSSLGAFVVFLDTTIVNVAFVAISRGLHSTTGHLAWVLNVYSLVFAAVLIPAGRLADRYGRKRLFLVGVAGFALTSALCGLAPDAGVLIGGRALQAVFAALVTPTSLALILPEFPPERRPFAIGTWGSMSALAAALGPTLGALLTEYASWRWIFLVNVPICALILGFGLRALRESRDPAARGLPDPLGTVLIAAIPAALSFALIQGPGWGWTDARVLAGFAAAAALVPVFLLRSRTAARPVMDLSLFRVPAFRLVNASTLVFAAAFYGTLLANIVFLQTVWHYSVLRSAFAVSPAPIVVAVIARPATRLAHARGPRPVLTAGAVLYAAALAGFATVTGAHAHYATHYLPIALVMGVGIGLTLPVQSSAAVQALPPGRFAVGSAVNACFRQLGAVLGISLFVAVLGAPGPLGALGAFRHVWWLFAALGLGSGLVLWVARMGPRPARDAAAAPQPGGRAAAAAAVDA
jgi:EmrB/QacA subfamily drug resistance transporter